MNVSSEYKKVILFREWFEGRHEFVNHVWTSFSTYKFQKMDAANTGMIGSVDYKVTLVILSFEVSGIFQDFQEAPECVLVRVQAL